MPKKITLLFLFLASVQFQCKPKADPITYKSETLNIYPISENSFVHVSYLETSEFGKVACNGMVYINDNEAVVFDTPVDNKSSWELIEWIRGTQKAKIKGVIFNHFHEDCTGGQTVFANEKIQSYSHKKTFDLLGEAYGPRVFEERMYLQVGNEEISAHYLGKAHTEDNIVCYIPSEELLFGGCMIKSIGAKKGYLGDAHLGEWSNTVRKIKENYPNLRTVVPGHGKYGDTELLDYTIQLFETE